MREVDLTGMARDDTVIVRLPNGRLIEFEWLDGENNSMIIQGFESQQRHEADETYRTSGSDSNVCCVPLP